MTTLNFKDELTENTFSYNNGFTYSDLHSFGLYFQEDSKNYPFILRGGISDRIDLQYSNTYQLRNRLLNTKKIKEVMDSARVPIRVSIRNAVYYIGKGFLGIHNTGTDRELLFIACIDGTKELPSMEDVKFFVSKKIYADDHKALQPAIKDLITAHVGDIIICNNILDYVGERITMPQGGSIASRKRYQDAIVRTTIMEILPDRPTVVTPVIAGFEEGSVMPYTWSIDSNGVSPW